MKSFRTILIVILAGIFSLPVRAGSQEEVPAAPLRIPKRCGLCHLERIEPPRDGSFNFLTLRKEKFSGGRGICYSCHNGPVRDSRRSIWVGLQHSSDGTSVAMKPGVRASCGTCHSPHGTEEGISTFMRFDKGTFGYCLRCHPARSGRRTGEHPSVSAGLDGRMLATPNCGACHRMHRAPGKGLIVRADTEILCRRCHEENPSREGKGAGSASHPLGEQGPACRTCHLVHRAPVKGLVKKDVGDSTLCRRCHEERAGLGSGDGNHPVRPGEIDCLSCHRMHNAAAPGKGGNLLQSDGSGADDPCRSCHTALADEEAGENHPVGVPADGASPERLRKLARFGGFLGAEREVICLTCHRAHEAREGAAMLVTRREAICLYCHNAQNSLAWETARPGIHPVSVRPKKASVPDSLRRAGDAVAGRETLSCLSCHRTHDGAPGTPGLLLPEEEFACTLCHPEPPDFAVSAHGSTAAAEGAGACRTCHGYHQWNIDLDAVSMGGNVSEKICWACHGFEGRSPMESFFGHIVGVPVPALEGKNSPPLFLESGRVSPEGLVGCPTCHDVHQGPSGPLLRLRSEEKASDLCLACHPRQEPIVRSRHDISLLIPGEENRRGERASETGPCGVCHLVHTESPAEPWARPHPEGATPGSRSALCITCHAEGAPASSAVVSEMGHPSAELLEIEPDIRIVDCDGCHDPHRWNPSDPTDRGESAAEGDSSNSFLALPADGSSELCRQCHEAQSAVVGTKHDLPEEGKRGVCGNCHISHGGEALLLWPPPLSGQGAFGTETCLTCHWEKGPSQQSVETSSQHPVRVLSVARSPDNLPLYAAAGRHHPAGKISCGTCHDPHRWTPHDERAFDPSAPGTPATSFLRVEADGFSPLCQSCHARESMVVGTDHDLRVTAPGSVNNRGEPPAESGVCGVCHRSHGGSQGSILWSRDLGNGEDPQSRTCRSCHEGAGSGKGSIPPRLEAHLVAYPGRGMVSRPFTRRSSFISAGFRSLRLYSRDGEIKNRGYISCASCHDPHLWTPKARLPGPGIPVDGDLSNSFLKVKDNFAVTRFFCRRCHGEETLELYQKYHLPGAGGGKGDDQPP